jgi:WD40 repeat protein
MKSILVLLLIINTINIYPQNKDFVIVPPVGHTAQVTDMDISKDGRYILSSSIDKKLILWDYITGYEIKSFTGTEYASTSCAISSDNKYAVSCGFDNYIRIWDIESGKQILAWDATEYGANKVRFINATDYIISAGRTGKINKWNYKTGELVNSKDLHTGNLQALQIDKSGQFSVSAGQDKNIVIHNINNNETIHSFEAHTADITSLAVSSGNKYIASASYDMTVKVWNLETYELVYDFNIPTQMLVDVDFSPDETKLAAISITGLIYEWDMKTGKKLFEEPVNSPMGKVLRYTSDGRVIISCGYDASVKFTNSVTGRFLREFKALSSPIDAMNINESADLLATAHRDTFLRFFDLNTASMHKAIKTDKWLFSSVEFLDERNNLIASFSEGNPGIFDIIEQEIFPISTNHHMGLTDIKINAEHSLILTSSHDSSGLVTNINTGAILVNHKHEHTVTSVAISPDEKFFFSAGLDGRILISEIESGRMIGEIKDINKEVSVIATSPQKNLLAAGLWTGEIIIYDYKNLNELKRIKPHKWAVSDMVFSNDSKQILSASWDTNLKLTNWAEDIEAAAYTGHTNCISSVLFSPDQQYVISAGWDNMIKILNAEDLTEIVSIIFIDESDYLVVRPDMYYFGTPDAAKKISFTKGMQTFGFEQFDLQYNRPDKVLEVLPYADTSLIPLYKQAYERRLQKTGFNLRQFQDKINVPSIQITNLDEIEFNSISEHVTIEFEASEESFFIDRFNIYVNGVPEFGSNGQRVKKLLKNVRNKHKLRLNPGRNIIELTCINSAGVQSVKQSVEIVYIPDEEQLGDAYIISVAVAEYENPQYNLRYTLNDGKELISTFRKVDGYNIIYTDSLFGKDCNRQNFDRLRKLLEKTDVNDLVVLHFAGHGLLDEEMNFWFATHDTDFDNPSIKGIEYSQIESLIDNIPARKKLVLIDACHSGEFDIEQDLPQSFDSNDDKISSRGVAVFSMPREESRSVAGLKNSFELMTELFTDVRKGTGAVIVSAATGSGYAIEFRELQHGIFTYSVLNGIRDSEADLNKDSTITVSELREYVLSEVERISNGQQKATSRTDNLIYDFKVF